MLAASEAHAENSSPDMAHSRHQVLVAASSVSILLLAVGGWLTSIGMGPWYEALEFPPFQPPAWVFSPAWIVVLALLAVATWTASRARRSEAQIFALYGAQCVLNVGWSLLFFTLARPDAALIWLFALDATVLLMILAYSRASRAAGLMLAPYLAWLLFATAINGWIVTHNAPFG